MKNIDFFTQMFITRAFMQPFLYRTWKNNIRDTHTCIISWSASSSALSAASSLSISLMTCRLCACLYVCMYVMCSVQPRPCPFQWAPAGYVYVCMCVFVHVCNRNLASAFYLEAPMNPTYGCALGAGLAHHLSCLYQAPPQKTSPHWFPVSRYSIKYITCTHVHACICMYVWIVFSCVCVRVRARACVCYTHTNRNYNMQKNQ